MTWLAKADRQQLHHKGEHWYFQLDVASSSPTWNQAFHAFFFCRQCNPMTTFGILSKQGILTWKYKEGEESDLVYPTQAKKKEVFSNIKKPIGLNCHARHALNCGTLSLKIPKRENEAESILCPFAQFSKCDSIIILKKTHVVNYDPELFKMFFSVFGAKVAASYFCWKQK